MKCDHEHDDGAYVLGALSPGERAEYERHLATCSFCREAVAEIAVLPGLLGRLDPTDFADFADFAGPVERSRVPDLVTAARTTRRRERRARRWRYVGAALAAACLAVVVGLGMTIGRGGDPDVGMVAMQPVSGTVPVTAEIGLRGTGWGTEVTMNCAYQSNGSSTKAYTFRLVAYGPDNASEQVSSWIAAPGAEVSVKGATRFSGADLVRFELVRYDGTPLLAYDVR